MAIAPHLLFLFMMFGTGCADQMPVTARYIPADCPTAAGSSTEEPLPAPLEPVVVGVAQEDEERIDLNSATRSQLESLPGVGPALAGRIITYREKRRFERVAHLKRVRGIGPATFAKLRDLVVVQNSKP